eukprot:jgi/Bigna1/80382/fgenesh1_pg.70_\
MSSKGGDNAPKIPTLGEFVKAAKLEGVSASGLLSCDLNEIEILAKVLGLKPGHRARFIRAYLFHKNGMEAEQEKKEEASEKNELVLVDTILPFATFLTTLDAKDKPAFIDFMENAGDAAIKMRNVFHNIDKNGDLVLDEGEFVEGIASILESSKEWLVPYITYMSNNAPYFITPEERGWLLQCLEYLKKHFVKKLYPEVKKAAKESKKFKEWFRMVDTNKDGHIDAREFSRGTVLLIFQAVDKIVLQAAKTAMEKGVKPARAPCAAPQQALAIIVFFFRGKNTSVSVSGSRDLSNINIPVPVRCINREYLLPQRRLGRECGAKVEGKLLPLLADTRAIQNPNSNPNADWSKTPTATAAAPRRRGGHIEAPTATTAKGKGTAKRSCGATAPNQQSARAPVVHTGAAILTSTRPTTSLSRDSLVRLRDAWLHQARGEHASVASFAGHTMELMKAALAAAQG